MIRKTSSERHLRKMTATVVFSLCVLTLWAADTASPVVRRLYRSPRLTRGNTNIMKIQPIDDAAWLWMPGDSGQSRIGEGAMGSHPSGGNVTDPVFLRFRNAFDVGEDDGKLVIDVSADERFYLTCDGAFVARGPNRSTVENWQYNTYEIDLKPGRHVIEATVWKIGDKGPLAQLSWRGGFILKANEAYDKRLTTGIAKWKVGKLSGIVSAGTDNGVWGTGAQWQITGSGILASEPSAWCEAEVVRGLAGRPGDTTVGLRTNGWMLFPSQLPDQTQDIVRPGRIVALTHDASWRGRHVYTEAETNDVLLKAVNTLLRPNGGRITLSPHWKLQMAWDLGRYICAYPVLKMKGAEGARVSWTWTEATQRATDNLKGGEPGARDAIVGRYLNGYGDTFVCDGVREGAFTTPWFRCGKWCRLDIETGDAPLEITDIHLVESRYPLEMEGAFSSPDDASLGDIRRISLRAMQMCSHEMLFDCPYYEQQMYPGDTRVQLNVLSALTRDDRLIKRAIELYDLGARDDGQVPFNWPTRGTQEGATYTLCYLLMYGDYVMNHADRAWLRARLPGLRKAMAGMELYENAQGLLENLPGWNFMDWVVGWDGAGTAPGGRSGDGVNAEANLFWSLAMRSAACVERALGNDLQAQYWETKRQALNAKIIETFWCAGRGILADTPAMKDFSEHAQCLALVGDVLPEDLSRTCFDHLVTDADLKRTTVYFSYYLFECYFKFGRGDLFLKRLDLWRDYVKKGLTTTQEAPDWADEKGKGHESRSDCHAWGAHPVWFMQTGLAGIRSSAPFFREVLVAPCPGGLSALQARHPHPDGFVEVDLKFANGAATGRVTTPVPGTFRFGSQCVALVSGVNEIVRDQSQPRSHANFQSDPNEFQFAIVPDRCGGDKRGAFTNALAKLNLLRPEFVMSVGDLIDISWVPADQIRRQQVALTNAIAAVKAPFYYVVGNHDITRSTPKLTNGNEVSTAVWKEFHGPNTYYSFVYRNVLFLCLNTMEGRCGPHNTQTDITPTQYDWIRRELAAHPDVRWIFIFMHTPSTWNTKAWLALEDGPLLTRRYTVFAGDWHEYLHARRNGHDYYALSVAGGVGANGWLEDTLRGTDGRGRRADWSKLRGAAYGEMDHLTWVTVAKEGPVVANLLLDGILPGEYLNQSNSPSRHFSEALDRPVPPEAQRRVDANRRLHDEWRRSRKDNLKGGAQ